MYGYNGNHDFRVGDRVLVRFKSKSIDTNRYDFWEERYAIVLGTSAINKREAVIVEAEGKREDFHISFLTHVSMTLCGECDKQYEFNEDYLCEECRKRA